MEQKEGAKTEVENGDNIKSEAKDGEEGSENKGDAEIKVSLLFSANILF